MDQGGDHGGREHEVLRQYEARPGRKFAYEERQKGSKGSSREPPRWARNEGKSQGWGRQSWQAAGRVAGGLLSNFIPTYKHCSKPDLSNLVSTVSSFALEVKCEGSFNSWVQFSVCGYMSMFMRGAHGGGIWSFSSEFPPRSLECGFYDLVHSSPVPPFSSLTFTDDPAKFS